MWTKVYLGFEDQREIHKQFNGLSKPKTEYFIDDIIPYVN